MVSYAVHSGRALKFVKNHKRTVRVICKGGQGNCQWNMYCGKLPSDATWQLRKVEDKHTCSRVFKVDMLGTNG